LVRVADIEAEMQKTALPFLARGTLGALHLIGEALLVGVESCGLFGDGVGGFFEVVGDFDDAGDVGREGGDVFGYVLPVDCRCAGPEMIVFCALVVVEVELGDAGFEEFEGFVDTDVIFGANEVGVAYIEADANAIEVADAEDFQDVLGGGDFVLQVLDENADAKGVGEGLEVFDGGEGVLEGAGVPGIVLLAEVEDAGVDGDLLGGLEGTLDLVHGGDAVGFFGVDEIDIGGDVSGPLSASPVGEVEGLMECGGYASVAEPSGDVADGGPIAVVEVVAGGEDLDSLSAGVVEGVEQAGMEALLEEDVG
jgi:hypothetical protein